MNLPDGYRLRPGARDDIPAICAIETRVFTDPWDMEDFLDGAAELLVIEAPAGEIAAYLCHHRRENELHIVNLAVAETHRRKGLATGLLGRVIKDASAVGLDLAFLEVRRSNAGARALYRKLGWRSLTITRGYYENGEDAVIYWKGWAGEAQKGLDHGVA